MSGELFEIVKPKSNYTWLIIVVVLAVVALLVLPKMKKVGEKFTELLTTKEHMADVESTTKMSATGNLVSETNMTDIDNKKLSEMQCSRACCSPQWGVETEKDDRIQPNDLGTKYMPTNYMCNGENPGDKGHGCVCVTKDAFDYLGERGGNNVQ